MYGNSDNTYKNLPKAINSDNLESVFTKEETEPVAAQKEPKSYEIQKGDCLWNIVKEQYGYDSNNDILNMVNRIVEENNIDNPNLIYSGDNIILPDLYTEQIKSEKEEPEKSRADEFDEWTNSEKNYNDFLEYKPVDEFEMFDFDASSYSKDLKNFAQEYLNKYDADNDGVMNKSEFTKMASGGMEIPKELEAEYNALYDVLFDNLNLDEKKNEINAGEFASFLYMADLDLDNYAKTLDVASSLDGKLDYGQYQALSSLLPGDKGFDILQSEKQDFYNNFYA